MWDCGVCLFIVLCLLCGLFDVARVIVGFSVVLVVALCGVLFVFLGCFCVIDACLIWFRLLVCTGF